MRIIAAGPNQNEGGDGEQALRVAEYERCLAALTTGLRRKALLFTHAAARASSRRPSLLMQFAASHQALGDVGRLQRRAFGW